MKDNTINVNKIDLGFLGEEYQKQLVKCLIEDQRYFMDLYSILDQNKFTSEPLRRIVGYMKDRYAEAGVVATYSDLKVMIRSKISDEITSKTLIALLKELYDLKFESIDLIKNTCGNFFKQQNLIRTLKEVNNIVKTGDFNRYDEIVHKIQSAIEVNEQKTLAGKLYENIEEDLSEDYRVTIPTGADMLDDALYGGLAKGQLGMIISPMGVGKAQPLSSHVLTADGFKRMGDIQLGEKVLDMDGKYYPIIGIYPQGIRPVYEITFSDGSIVECDINHLWYVRVDDGEYKTVSMKSMLNEHREYIVPKYEKTKSEVRVTDIKYVRDDRTQCILVNSPSHLYITDDYIVTHNTSATTGFAANAAITKSPENNYKGWKVLHIFFEDREVDIRRKYYGFVTDIDAQDLSLPDIRPKAIQILRENSEINRLLKENIRYKRFRSMEKSASDIEDLIKMEIAHGFKPDLVIIDYFECLAPEKVQYSYKGNEWEKENLTIRKLENLTCEYDVAIWVPMQGNRESIGLEKVGLAQGGGSIKKTQAAHIVITFAQTDEQKVQGKMNIFLAKLRSGKIKRNSFYNVDFNNGTCKFDMSSTDADTRALDEDRRFNDEQEQGAMMARHNNNFGR